MYFLWTMPVAIVAILIASGRATSVATGFCGLLTALVVALGAAPIKFALADAILAIAQGAWLAILVAAVIFGGLFFREIVAAIAVVTAPTPIAPDMRRRQLYTACFLLGPFAEAATGYGVGQVTIAPILKRIGLSPADAVLFGLFSQMLVPWGASANGTIVGSQLAGVSSTVLGTQSALLTLPLILAWLCLFWRFTSVAGLHGTAAAFISEMAFAVTAAGLLVLANYELGPEIAAMAALGPLIALRFAFEAKLDRDQWQAAIRAGLPYGALIFGLAATRAIQPMNAFLERLVVQPFAQGSPWFPLLHPSSWLLFVGCLTALAMGREGSIAVALHRAWTEGKRSTYAIVLFLGMAQVMTSSGMATGLAEGIANILGPLSPLATPLLAGLFGFVTGSLSTTNGLLMPSQAALAVAAHVNATWLAAVQNVAGAALTMLSPIRVAVGCALVDRRDLERRIYSRAWGLGAAPVLILVLVTAILIV